ncbi:MAG: formate/nitrite transporter family protein [Bacillota bacterium]
MDRVKKFISAIFAGMCIGMGAVVFLQQENNMIGSFLFAIGLFSVVIFKFQLFTGRVGYLPYKNFDYVLELCIIWFGNLLGTCLIAITIQMTRIYPLIEERVVAISQLKLNDDLLSILILSFYCGILMFVAVESSKNESVQLPFKFPVVFLPVMVFILSGYEHVIANMVYFSLAKVWDFNTLIYVIVMTIGNSLGGMFIPFYLKYFRLPISE